MAERDPKYVVVRTYPEKIEKGLKVAKRDDPVTGDKRKGGEIVEELDLLNDAGKVYIVKFVDPDEAVAFSLNKPHWDGTVQPDLDNARRTATAKAEGQ